MPLFNVGKALDRSWLSGTWRLMLLKGTWTPDIDARFVSDVVAFEAVGDNYARKDVTGRFVDVSDHADHLADNLAWPALTCADFRYAVLYQLGTGDADSVLLNYLDLGPQDVTTTNVVIQWNGGTPNGVVFRGQS